MPPLETYPPRLGGPSDAPIVWLRECLVAQDRQMAVATTEGVLQLVDDAAPMPGPTSSLPDQHMTTYKSWSLKRSSFFLVFISSFTTTPGAGANNEIHIGAGCTSFCRNGRSLRFAVGSRLWFCVLVQLHPTNSNKIARVFPLHCARKRLRQNVRNLVPVLTLMRLKWRTALSTMPKKLTAFHLRALRGISSLNDANGRQGNLGLLIEMDVQTTKRRNGFSFCSTYVIQLGVNIHQYWVTPLTAWKWHRLGVATSLLLCLGSIKQFPQHTHK